jgi:hypothetical protein
MDHKLKYCSPGWRRSILAFAESQLTLPNYMKYLSDLESKQIAAYYSVRKELDLY